VSDDKCHDCGGSGWIQIIEPPVYVRTDTDSTDQTLPRLLSAGTARAAICPLCNGTGRRES